MKRRLFVLGAGRAQLPVLHAAQRLGLSVLAADPDPAAPGFALADARLCCDLADVQCLTAEARSWGAEGALTFAADYPMPALAAVCDALGLPGPGVATVLRATHKAHMRRALVDAGVPCPAFEHVTDLASAHAAAQRIGGELVIKPAQSSGGRGVTGVRADAPAAALDAAFAHAAAFSRAGQGVMVEHRVTGDEFSVELLCHGGQAQVLAVTDKLTTGAPHFVEIGHQQPSRLGAAALAAVEAAALATVRALGITNAAAHVELRLAEEGPVIMEAAARAGGGCISSHLVPLSTGIDMVAACIAIALGEPPRLDPQAAPQAAAIRFVTTPAGTIARVAGLDEARAMAGVVEAEAYVTPGRRIGRLVDATARCGHAIATGPTVAAAIARAEAARDRIRVTLAD
jgi:biotin carboxylase